MPNSALLKDAANNLIAAAREFIEAVEAEEAASGSAVPAHLVNVPPGTRAARPELATVDPLTGEQRDPARQAADKTAASDAISAASDESKADETQPTTASARRSSSG